MRPLVSSMPFTYQLGLSLDSDVGNIIQNSCSSWKVRHIRNSAQLVRGWMFSRNKHISRSKKRLSGFSCSPAAPRVRRGANVRRWPKCEPPSHIGSTWAEGLIPFQTSQVQPSSTLPPTPLALPHRAIYQGFAHTHVHTWADRKHTEYLTRTYSSTRIIFGPHIMLEVFSVLSVWWFKQLRLWSGSSVDSWRPVVPKKCTSSISQCNGIYN